MENPAPISPKLPDLLQSVDMCTIANAIETLSVRTGAHPISNLCHYGRTDWCEYVAQFPSPKIMVLADVDRSPGTGAFVGEIHAEIHRALGGAGYVTNRAIRDVPALERDRFQCFSSARCPSDACGHIENFGEPLEIGCLKITRGDLLQGNRHGVQSIPRGIDAHLADAVRTIHSHEAELIGLCISADFSVKRLTPTLRKDI
jgi:regulator of RNase E activity RraA